MIDRAVLSEEHEVVPLLKQMHLDRGILIDILRVAASERALCTSNDVRGRDLMTMNHAVIRGLRDAFCGEKWKKDEQDNQEGIANTELGLRVIACNFDRFTGDLHKNPTNISPKGSASNKKAQCNQTAWLPGLPEVPTRKGDALVTWILGSFVDDESLLKGELSLPLTFANNQYRRFERRIILLDGSEGQTPDPVRAPTDREGPVEIMDVTVRRK